jgi:ABC-type nitrate/sulfonate/bicarbonate transport system permease component
MVCGLAAAPNLLVLDETLVSRDTTLLEDSLRILAEFAKQHPEAAVLLVSHDERVLSACDKVYEFRRDDVVAQVRERVDCGEKDDPEYLGAPSDRILSSLRHEEPVRRPTRIGKISGMVIGSLLATAIAAVVLFSPMVSPREKIREFMPSVGSVFLAAYARLHVLLGEGLWSVGCAGAALILSVASSVALWAVLLQLGKTGRSIALSTCVAMQGIPIVVLLPLLYAWGIPRGIASEVAVGMFITAFPIGIVGARQVLAVSGDVFRAHSSAAGSGRIVTAVYYRWGTLVRTVVACSPLAGVGVVVAEFIAGDRGLGYQLFRSLSDPTMATRWVFAGACVLVCMAILALSSFIAAALLPADVNL